MAGVCAATGLPGNVEIPALGTDGGRTIYCVYSQSVSSIRIQWTTDAGQRWAPPVQAMGLPTPTYITDANVLVDGQRVTVLATHVLDSPDDPGRIARSALQVAVSEDGGTGRPGADRGREPPVRARTPAHCGCSS